MGRQYHSTLVYVELTYDCILKGLSRCRGVFFLDGLFAGRNDALDVGFRPLFAGLGCGFTLSPILASVTSFGPVAGCILGSSLPRSLRIGCLGICALLVLAIPLLHGIFHLFESRHAVTLKGYLR